MRANSVTPVMSLPWLVISASAFGSGGSLWRLPVNDRNRPIPTRRVRETM